MRLGPSLCTLHAAPPLPHCELAGIAPSQVAAVLSSQVARLLRRCPCAPHAHVHRSLRCKPRSGQPAAPPRRNCLIGLGRLLTCPRPIDTSVCPKTDCNAACICTCPWHPDKCPRPGFSRAWSALPLFSRASSFHGSPFMSPAPTARAQSAIMPRPCWWVTASRSESLLLLIW